MFFLHRFGIWCKRFRHRCGYGVHSPSDFFLITSVIYERAPYYAYRSLKKRSFSPYLPHYRGKVNRLLFRLVNFYRPRTLIEVGIGNGASIGYMRAGCQTMESVTMKGRNCEQTRRLLGQHLEQMQQVDCLHIAHTPYYKEVFEQVLPHLHPGSWIIIGGIHATKDKKAWWKQVVDDPRTVITYDLYDIGLVFFPEKRYKQHYIVNFL